MNDFNHRLVFNWRFNGMKLLSDMLLQIDKQQNISRFRKLFIISKEENCVFLI